MAAEWAAKAVDVTTRTRRRKYEVLARVHLGRALVALGRKDDGLRELRSAVEIADALVNPVGRWQSRAALADALQTTGDEEDASATRSEARRILTDVRWRPSRLAVRTLLARLACPGESSRSSRRCAELSVGHLLSQGQRVPAAIRPAALPSPYSGGASAGNDSSPNRSGDRVRVVVDEHVRAGLHGVDPFRRGAHRDARDAVPVRLLLETARVGRRSRAPATRPRRRRGSRAARGARRSRPSGIASAASTRARARVRGKDDGLVEPGEPVDDPRAGARAARSPRGGRSPRRTCRAGAAADTRSRAIGAKRRAASAITSPTTSARPRDALRRRAWPAERSSGQRRSAASRSTSIRARSSGIDRSPLRSPASTCASGIRPPSRRALRRGSSSCPRGRTTASGASASITARSGRVSVSTSAVRRSSRCSARRGRARR